jgi:hypothetical protein
MLVPASAVSWQEGPSPDGIECVRALTVALPTKVNATRTTRHRSSTERIAIGYSITLSFSIRPAIRGRAALPDASARWTRRYCAALRQKGAPPDQHDVSEHAPLNHRRRPNTPQPKLWRVTSLSRPTVTSLSGVYKTLRGSNVMECRRDVRFRPQTAKVRCPLFPQQRTFIRTTVTSALCLPEADMARPECLSARS